jgi:hypothetical protein
MKKYLLLLCLCMMGNAVFAQPVSFNSRKIIQSQPGNNFEKTNRLIVSDTIKKTGLYTQAYARELVHKDESQTRRLVNQAKLNSLAYMQDLRNDPLISNEDYRSKETEEQKNLLFIIDSLETRHAIHRNTVLSRVYRKQDWFLPAFYSGQAIMFYTEQEENDKKFFSNTLLNYNSTDQKISLFNEIFNDYFGPVRIGVGFMLTSTSKDSIIATKEKKDLVQKIASGGGNFNISAGMPFLKFTEEDQVVKIKSSIQIKTGLDIPKTGETTADYGFFSDLGINTSFYSEGVFKNISLYATSKLSYITGNAQFEKRLTANNFFMSQLSVGIAVKDMFRVRMDFYQGNDFVRSSFPATVSFEIFTGR